MAHPFLKMLDAALKKSGEENMVLRVARGLYEKGYRDSEIVMVLTQLQKSLIDDREIAVVTDALEQFKEDINFDDGSTDE